MTRKDFLYALENEGLINCVRDDDWINVNETLQSTDCKTGCWLHWEWLDIRTIYRIIDDEWGFED